jgi:long-chain acyl-CoA synthetase
MSPTASTVRALVQRAAAATPQAVYALATESGEQIDFAGLQRGCRRVAAALASHGVRPGDTVALVLPNGLGTLQWLLGAMHAGICVIPVNLLSTPEAMRHVVEHGDARLVLAAPEWVAPLRGLLPAVPVVEVDPDARALPDTELDTPAPDPQSMALLMYTSGTTGRPKGVMLTQANLAANAAAIAAEHALTPADRVLGVLPLYHINAFAVTMLAPLASGGSVAMAPRFSVQRFWAQARDCGCTWINVGADHHRLPARGAGATRRRPRRAAPVPQRQRGLAARASPRLRSPLRLGIIETMGLTETAAPSFSNPLEPSRRKLGSVGRASGRRGACGRRRAAPLPDGCTGEITIRGPHVMKGYYKNADATAAAFTPDGWLRTGDLGHRDADGFFFVTGRIKELIIKGGENIAPREIDEALLRHPAVLDAAAVGVPDPHYGQEILACVVLREGATADEAALRAHCEGLLGRYKTPRRFRFVAELPRGPSGKVQRLKLAEAN